MNKAVGRDFQIPVMHASQDNRPLSRNGKAAQGSGNVAGVTPQTHRTLTTEDKVRSTEYSTEYNLPYYRHGPTPRASQSQPSVEMPRAPLEYSSGTVMGKAVVEICSMTLG
uniref:Uncharacterized protein n=1 Tax=Coccidioides posadasii RMSCC 3488 TaxID=454284 RepID=A0A0J6FFC7_COCPO|nr:hypothetical protein CPAG_03912 [Coccidioides posadasii RMSCC 3488]